MAAAIETDVVVVGAGFAGLATAAALREQAVEFVLLEQGAEVGAFWAGHYDRIRLHSPGHDLPHDGGLRARFARFLGRDDLLAYLQAYAKRHDLYAHALFGQRVRAATASRGTWTVETETHRFSATCLVVATGAQRAPVCAPIPERERFRGFVIHSRGYRNPTAYRGARVLVVGSGNSAAEIALDLSAGGATPTLWVRGPRHFVPLAHVARLAWAWSRVPSRAREALLDRAHGIRRHSPAFRAAIARRDRLFAPWSLDLSRHGIRRPERGPLLEMYEGGRVPVYDQGTAAAIAAGRIAVVDGNERPLVAFAERGVWLGDRAEPFDGVVLATGFAPGLEQLLPDHERLVALDPAFGVRMPITDGNARSTVEPTLFFPGFDLSSIGGLGLGRWGWEVGTTIAAELS